MSFNDVTSWIPNADRVFFDQARFDALFRFLPVPIYLWQLDGHSFDPKLIDCNDAAVHVTGKGIYGYLGRTLRELLPQDGETQRCLRECLLNRLTVAEGGVNPFVANSPVDLTYIFVPPNMAALVAVSRKSLDPTVQRNPV